MRNTMRYNPVTEVLHGTVSAQPVLGKERIKLRDRSSNNLIAQFITILLSAGQNKAVYFVLVVTAPEPRPFQKTAKKIVAAYFTK